MKLRFLVWIAALALPLMAARSVSAAIMDCGKAPPLSDEDVRLDLTGKAQVIVRKISGGLEGSFARSRREILSKYPHADALLLNAFYVWEVCQLVSTDPKLTTEERLRIIRDSRVSFIMSPPRSRVPNSEPLHVPHKRTSDATQRLTAPRPPYEPVSLLVESQDSAALHYGKPIELVLTFFNESGSEVTIADLQILVFHFKDEDIRGIARWGSAYNSAAEDGAYYIDPFFRPQRRLEKWTTSLPEARRFELPLQWPFPGGMAEMGTPAQMLVNGKDVGNVVRIPPGTVTQVGVSFSQPAHLEMMPAFNGSGSAIIFSATAPAAGRTFRICPAIFSQEMSKASFQYGLLRKDSSLIYPASTSGGGCRLLEDRLHTSDSTTQVHH